jgi:hypothetical protein
MVSRYQYFGTHVAPSPTQVHRIACGKIEAVGFCIDAILELKARVGSLSLQGNGPFGSKTDILYV